MRIQFLYWEDCPSHPNALARLKDCLREMGIADEVTRIEVNTDEEARMRGFPGSPTIRINDEDIDQKGAREQRVGLSCRIYHHTDGGVTPIPPEELIRKALERAIKEKNSHDPSNR